MRNKDTLYIFPKVGASQRASLDVYSLNIKIPKVGVS